jgi:hypothetical protein
MASRAIFDPSRCFPHLLLPSQPSTAKVPQARRISDCLEVVSIDGKGLGVVATRYVEAYTLLYESPSATVWG